MSHKRMFVLLTKRIFFNGLEEQFQMMTFFLGHYTILVRTCFELGLWLAAFCNPLAF